MSWQKSELQFEYLLNQMQIQTCKYIKLEDLETAD